MYTRGPLVAANTNPLGSWCIYLAGKDGKPNAIHNFALGDACERDDAVLWAAAPEMLAALEAAVADAEQAANPSARFHQYELAKAAIAKAKPTP